MSEPEWLEEARRQIREGIKQGHIDGGFTPEQAQKMADLWDGVIKVSPVDTKTGEVPKTTG
jgi:hypothetical protein